MKNTYQKTGYLKEEYKIFHLKGSLNQPVGYHYHDFHKIFIFLKGNADYLIEGREYTLQPNDIVFVGAGEIHKPVPQDDFPYERIIMYLSPALFESISTYGCDLFSCFEKMLQNHSSILRLPENYMTRFLDITHELAASSQSAEFAASLLERIKLMEALILLNRFFQTDYTDHVTEIPSHPAIRATISYITAHITENLSIDQLAKSVYLDRSYLMHLFKSETGYTIGKYITEKRLFLARQYISEGYSITDSCFKCGFNNYASFYHAYKAKYGTSPKTASSGTLSVHMFLE